MDDDITIIAEDGENTELDETLEDEKTLEEQVADLKSQVAALTELVDLLYSETDYELSYSGEQVDEVCEKVFNITPSASTISDTVSKYSQVGANYGITQLNAILDKANILQNPSVVNAAASRLNPLVQKWGSFTKAAHVNSDSGGQWITGTHSISVPTNTTDTAIFALCDFANSTFDSTQFAYTFNGSKIDYTIYLHHSAEQGGDYNFKVYYLLIGKRTGGGSIG